jgi:hypothetical protein
MMTLSKRSHRQTDRQTGAINDDFFTSRRQRRSNLRDFSGREQRGRPDVGKKTGSRIFRPSSGTKFIKLFMVVIY